MHDSDIHTCTYYYMCVKDDETAHTTYDKENFVSTVKPKTCQVSARLPA